MFEARIYRFSTELSGDASAAMDVGRIALLSQGFKILSDTGSELHAHGPGMHSNSQPPIVGASDFIIQVGASTAAAIATLGGIARMKIFLYLFPPGLALSLGMFGVFAAIENLWYALLFAAPWLLFAPVMASAMEHKTIQAIDALIRGMAQAGARQ